MDLTKDNTVWVVHLLMFAADLFRPWGDSQTHNEVMYAYSSLDGAIFGMDWHSKSAVDDNDNVTSDSGKTMGGNDYNTNRFAHGKVEIEPLSKEVAEELKVHNPEEALRYFVDFGEQCTIEPRAFGYVYEIYLEDLMRMHKGWTCDIIFMLQHQEV
jgi:hypothetical protein